MLGKGVRTLPPLQNLLALPRPHFPKKPTLDERLAWDGLFLRREPHVVGSVGII